MVTKVSSSIPAASQCGHQLPPVEATALVALRPMTRDQLSRVAQVAARRSGPECASIRIRNTGGGASTKDASGSRGRQAFPIADVVPHGPCPARSCPNETYEEHGNPARTGILACFDRPRRRVGIRHQASW